MRAVLASQTRLTVTVGSGSVFHDEYSADVGMIELEPRGGLITAGNTHVNHNTLLNWHREGRADIFQDGMNATFAMISYTGWDGPPV